MRRHVLGFLAIGLTAVLSRAVSAADDAGHRFGEWPAINAMLPDEKQHNLNPNDQDFLIEIWFKPLPKVKAKGMAPNTLVAKRLWDRLAGYELGYRPNGDVYFAVCDAGCELEGDLAVGAACGLQDDQWYYIAAARAGDSLRLYKDGSLAKDLSGRKIGRIANQDVFNVSLGHVRLPGPLPDQGDSLLAHEERSPGRFRPGRCGTPPHPGKTGRRFDRQRRLFPLDFQRRRRDRAGPGQQRQHADVRAAGLSPARRDPDQAFSREARGDDLLRGYRPPRCRRHESRQPAEAVPVDPAGAEAVAPGDVLHFCKGRYVLKDMLLLPRGENGKPVTVEGEEGTVLVGSEPITGWTKTADGIWVIKGWKGNYFGPSDPREWDVRSQPGNILFAGDDVMDYVATKADLAPGCWNLEPLEGHSPKTIYLCPPPGVDPNAAKHGDHGVCRFAPAFGVQPRPQPAFYPRRLRHGHRRPGPPDRAQPHRLDGRQRALGIYGQDIVIRNNLIEWTGGIGGAAPGSSSRTTSCGSTPGGSWMRAGRAEPSSSSPATWITVFAATSWPTTAPPPSGTTGQRRASRSRIT